MINAAQLAQTAKHGRFRRDLGRARASVNLTQACIHESQACKAQTISPVCMRSLTNWGVQQARSDQGSDESGVLAWKPWGILRLKFSGCVGHVILIQQIVSNFEVTATWLRPVVRPQHALMCAIIHVLLTSCVKWGPLNEEIAVFDDDYKIISTLPTLHHMVVTWVLIREMGFKTATSSSLEDPTSHLTRAAP